MNGLRVVRRIATTQRRNMGTRDIFENKNKIADTRKVFYSNPAVGAENPTYLKENGDKIVVGVAFTIFTTGIVCILSGLRDMSYGINKKN